MVNATIAGCGRPWPSARDRIWPGLELVGVIGLLELELWHLRSHGPAWLNVIVYGLIVALVVVSGRRRRLAGELGEVASVGRTRAWLEVGSAALVLSAILMGAAALVGDSNETFEFLFLDKPPLKLANWLVGKFGAALIQQLALQFFLWPVCFELTRSKAVGTVLAAALFGVIHLPSPTLVAITTLAGVVWITLYRRTARLAPLVVSHMILATLAHGGLPERLTFDMRVGLTATADMKRFEDLNDPRNRLINRRLKRSKADLKHYATQAYYDARGGTLPGFIRGLYRDILDRPAAEGDVAYWLDRKLAHPRDDIPSFFLGSDEYAAVQARRLAEGRERAVRR